eukprot:TRINITY_DN1186_c0_g1_i17.p2 TRINITY_DN1186_c0_g1~~TRINITY_DN1186_c0_g1_i17.p2  ORF type:complete len:297 (-),score=87.50 TRINITY_DN1186_c0_g1_i17:243-1133(-)
MARHSCWVVGAAMLLSLGTVLTFLTLAQAPQLPAAMQEQQQQPLPTQEVILRTLASVNSTRWLMHTYWFGGVGRKQTLALRSMLATLWEAGESVVMSHDISLAPNESELVQLQQRRKRVWLVLWVDSEIGWQNLETQSFDPMLRELLPWVSVVKYDPRALSVGTPLSGVPPGMVQTKRLDFRADYARILILYLFGGLWYDMDFVFFQSVVPLLEEAPNFAYPYGSTARINNAFMHITKGSSVAEDLITRCVREASAYPHSLSAYTQTKKHKDLALIESLSVQQATARRRTYVLNAD